MKNSDIVGLPSPLPDSIPTNKDIVKYVFYRKEKEVKQNFSYDYIINVTAGEIADHYKDKPYVSSVQKKDNIVKKISDLFRDLKKAKACSTTAPSHLRFLSKLDKTFVLGQYSLMPDRETVSEIASASESCSSSLFTENEPSSSDTDSFEPQVESETAPETDPECNSSLFTENARSSDYELLYADRNATQAACSSREDFRTAFDLDVELNFSHALIDELSRSSYADPTDTEWVPNPHDKALDVHPVIETVTGSMLRHGISCTSMVDIFKDFLPLIQGDGGMPHRIPTETELRTATDRKRASALSSVQKLRIEGLYFDGKEGDSLHHIGGKNVTTRDEMYALVGYPGEKSLGSCFVERGTGRGLASTIINYLEKYNIDHTSIVVLGSDGTNAITGYQDGALRHMQDILGRPCQLAICMLHNAELPLRGLFCFLDGVKAGKAQFGGSMGKAIAKNLQERPIGNFQRIFCPTFPHLPDHVVNDFSQDKRVLYLLCIACIDGYVSEGLAKTMIGILNHARWLTFGSRLIRYYMSTPEPSHAHKIEVLVRYIVQVYYQVHADVKLKPELEHGAVHLFNQLKYATDVQLTRKERQIVYEKFKNNSYYGHPESVILASVADEDMSIRRKGVSDVLKILDLEESRLQSKSNKVRVFYKPFLNLNAKHYRELPVYKEDVHGWWFKTGVAKTEWARVTIPPLLKNYTRREIINFMRKPLKTGFLNHQQGVERQVALMSTCTKAVVGEARKSGQQIAVQEHRLQNPSRQKRRRLI